MFLKKCICVLSIFIGLTFKQNIAEFSGFRPSSSTLRARFFSCMAFSVYANAEEKASARRVTPSNRKENSSSCVHVFDET